MKKIIENIKRNYRLVIVVLVIGGLLGFLFGSSPSNSQNKTSSNQNNIESEHQIWTCSMHPQIRMDKPGKCPICGMDLIPLQETSGSEAAVSPDEIQMTEEAVKIADIQTIVVQKAYPEKEVYLLGKVKPDERNISELTARFGGRIEKLYVNFTGQNVSKGEKLATIYSPAMVNAQKELLEAQVYKQSNPDLYKATRNKLKLWDLTNEQIDNIEQKGEVQSNFDILSPITGTVTLRNVSLGDYVKEGSALFQVIDLSRIWVMFEAYESDLPWINSGDRVKFTVQSLPGRNFNGRVSFIDPLIDPKTRIARVRVEVQNPVQILKPEMFANGIVTSTIAGDKKYLIIPRTSILWTGKRAVVYVKVPYRDQPTFKYRQIVLGPSAGDFYVVKEGLSEGEEIAVNGVFKIDAAAQLAGKPSMMNQPFANVSGGEPEGGRVSMEHNHADMSSSHTITENDEHDSGEQSQGDQIHQNTMDSNDMTSRNDVMSKESEKPEIDSKFKEQLTTVYEVYLPMKNAFVESDPHKVAQIAEKVSSALNEVDMELLKGQTHMDWMNQLKKLKENLGKMEQSHDIKIQREAFAAFNLAFYRVVKDFGLEGITAYYQYCPMAIGMKGAYWFSEIKEINNPYFGDAMLHCGETRETFEY